jgi:hypothetical protein
MRVMRTSAEWIAFFRGNEGVREFGVEEGRVTEEELRGVRASVQEFQLGESGEGSHVFRQAKRWVERSGDVEYLAALRLFIAEEIRHSRELGEWMDAHGIARVKKTWVDSVFRNMRRVAGLELSIAVLVCAEIVAMVYYAGLGEATGSTRLRRLCQQILTDEVGHLRFQCERLAILRRDLSELGLLWRDLAYGIFFRGTLLVVWWKHGRAMRAGGFGFLRFWRAGVREVREAMGVMDPRGYAWGDRDVPAPCVMQGT